MSINFIYHPQSSPTKKRIHLKKTITRITENFANNRSKMEDSLWLSPFPLAPESCVTSVPRVSVSDFAKGVNQKQILIYESINDATPYRNSASKDRTKSTVSATCTASATATASATSTVSSTASAASTGLALKRFVSIHVSMGLSNVSGEVFQIKETHEFKTLYHLICKIHFSSERYHLICKLHPFG